MALPTRTAPLLPLFVLALFFWGCDSDPGYEHTYTTRGVVAAMPGSKAYEEFMVRHEEIPDYVSLNGTIGMETMTMPFPVQNRDLLQGIKVGDKVEITYGETFEPKFRAGVISIRKLPDETKLDFE